MKDSSKCRSGWTLRRDENIENVERVSLEPELQRELGCSVGEHVFLEYPWAYVEREAVSRLANTTGSPLEPYRETIEAYGGDTFLVGYATAQLVGRDFVICLTEEARSAVARRNAEIGRRIRSEVTRMIRKIGGVWRSLGSEATLDESLVRDAREYFELEVRFPVGSLGATRVLSDRFSGDCRDGYAELLPYERFEHVEKRCVSKMIQTHFEPRAIEVQTYPGHPKNAWTQYIYEDTMRTRPDDGGGDAREEEDEESVAEKSEKESRREPSEERRDTTEGSREASESAAEPRPIERGPLELFLEERAQEMIDVVRYNAVVNLHVDDVETLRELDTARPRDEILAERFSLVGLRHATGRIVSGASWHPSLADCVTVSYVAVVENGATSETESTVLLWRYRVDSLRPRLLLRSRREIYCVSFCPTNGDFVIGGAASGEVVVWNNRGRMGTRDGAGGDERDAVTVASASVMSERDHSHERAIRGIHWLPDERRVEASGKLTRGSAGSSCQFVTVAEDGTVAIWDLLRYSITSQLKPEDFKDLDNGIRPIYRLDVRSSKDLPFAPLSLCLPSVNAFRDAFDKRDQVESARAADANKTRTLWIGTQQGELARCAWEGRSLDAEASGLEECKVIDSCSAHDGPVTAIHRSPHLRDVLLTIGGHVVAIWKDDYLELPLFRRRSEHPYTACCWSNRPGVFIAGTVRGELEVWDIRREAGEPVLTQTVCKQAITVLSLRESREPGLELIGVGDCNSIFRVFEEPTDSEDETVERMDWFEEYVWREVRRKKMFASWQRDFLRSDAAIIAKRQARAKEERRMKLEMARLQLQKQQEERLRLEAEREARQVPKSKDTVWKLSQERRMERVLLEKKRLVPRKLEEKRLPLVRLAEERELKMIKARNEATLRDKYFDNFVSLKFPEYYDLEEKDQGLEQQREVMEREEFIDVYLQEFCRIRDETRKLMAEKPYIPKFDRSIFTKKGNKMAPKI